MEGRTHHGDTLALTFHFYSAFLNKQARDSYRTHGHTTRLFSQRIGFEQTRLGKGGGKEEENILLSSVLLLSNLTVTANYRLPTVKRFPDCLTPVLPFSGKLSRQPQAKRRNVTALRDSFPLVDWRTIAFNAFLAWR